MEIMCYIPFEKPSFISDFSPSLGLQQKKRNNAGFRAVLEDHDEGAIMFSKQVFKCIQHGVLFLIGSPLLCLLSPKTYQTSTGLEERQKKIMYFVNKYFEQPHETLRFGFCCCSPPPPLSPSTPPPASSSPTLTSPGLFSRRCAVRQGVELCLDVHQGGPARPCQQSCIVHHQKVKVKK